MSDHTEETDDIIEDVEGEGTEESVEDWTPPTKEEFDKLVADKRKANYEASTRKKYLRANGFDHLTGDKLSAGSEETPATSPDSAIERERHLAKLEQAAEKKVDAIYASLDEYNVSPRSRQRVLKLLDRSAITVDEHGVDGVEEQMVSLKEEFPEFFKRTRTVAPDPTVVGTGTKKVSSADEPKDWKDEIRERFGKGLI